MCELLSVRKQGIAHIHLQRRFASEDLWKEKILDRELKRIERLRGESE